MRKKINLNWKFKKAGEEEWQIVNLPHDAMLYEKRDAMCHNGVNSGYFPGGKYIYEKALEISETILKADLRVSLFFEGVYQECKIYINDTFVMEHRYGYTEFEADITDYVKTGENVLRLEVDNSLEPNCRWYTGSGIYRDVYLITRKSNAPKTLHIKTKSYDPAIIQVETDLGALISEITYQDALADFEIIARKEDSDLSLLTYEIKIADAKLWNESTPNLYRITVNNNEGEISDFFGIRLLSWSAKTGLCVNGERVLLRGGCIHHDNGVLGACTYAEAEERRVRILKEAGYNAIRSAHNPMSRPMLDACDRLGMYVMDECFDGWYTPKTYHDYSRKFYECWQSDLKTMVDKDFNHPCVVMYSVGNEVSETASKKGVETCGMLRDFVNFLDDSRPVTAGINVLLNVYTNNGAGVYKDKGEYEAKPLPPKDKGYKEQLNGSAFFNMMAGKLGKLMFYMSAGKKGDKASKGAAQNLDIIGLNYAASRFDVDAKNYPDRIMVASETMVMDLPYNWERIKKYPQIIGDFVWASWDYLGEAGIGDYMYMSYPGLPILAGSGTIDITGDITAEAYYEQIIWGLRKEPYIGVRPLNHADEVPKKSSWRFTDAIASWTWKGFEGKKAVIDVFADADSVELIINGKSIGRKKLKDYRTIFKTSYEPGSVKVIAYDKAGIQIGQSSLITSDSAPGLVVKPETKEIKADGNSICYVPVEFTDENGVRKPYMEEEITLSVEGAGYLVGFGSAVAKTDESYVDNVTRSFRGRALAVIRSNGESGEIIVKAVSKSGYTAKTEIRAK